MEIKVGEYVRTKDGNITKIKALVGEDPDYKNMKIYEVDIILDKYNDLGLYEEDIKAHSPYIIDLIELGDVIKYKEMFETKANEPHILNLRNQKEVDKFKKCVEDKLVAYISVVTHEQFQGMEYKV